MSLSEIIYVDDDLEDLDFFAEAINDLTDNHNKKIGLTVFNSANDALPAILNSDPEKNLIFLDINMPGKTGFDILKEIRKHKDLEELAVMMFSTSNDCKSIETSYELKANLYAVKPHNLNVLKSLIQKAVDLDWKNFKAHRNNFVLNPNKV